LRLYVFAFGRLKAPGLRDAADHYKKLIRAWQPLEEFELKPLPVPDKSDALRQKIQEREAQSLSERLDALLSSRARIYLLDEGGKARATRDWAALVSSFKNDSVPEVAFCVGSSLGFSDALRKRASGILSLGPQTLPHELARVVLLEQLYRAWSVVQGHPYHNEG
jgi:23S rRNA (pseudouridine1915-N3)-methyltransferase